MQTVRLPSGATITTFRAPPPGMSLSDASDRVLAEYGLERPVGSPELHERWTQQLRTTRFVEPMFHMINRRAATPRRLATLEGPRSNVWAGAAVRARSGSSIAMATGMFSVPQVRLATPGRDQHVSFWLGIDDQPVDPMVPATTLVQAGVECDVSADGIVTVYPWWEWVPDVLVRILDPSARAGDLIQVQLTITSTTTATLAFTNLDEGRGSMFRLTAPPAVELIATRAVWIAERPDIGGVPAELAAFEPVRFDSCIAMSHAGVNGITDKHTLDETSPISPALASIGGLLFLAWKGDGNNSLNLIASDSAGQSFGSKLTLAQTTSQPPALCAHGNRLFLAWVAERTDQLHVAEVVFRGTTIDALTGILPLRETSPLGPALASLDNRLFLAWKGDGNDLLNVAVATDNAPGFTHKHTFAETSPRAPALCALDRDLFLAWSSPTSDQLHVANVAISGDTITGLATARALPETSPAGPALAAVDGRLALAWKGDGNNLLSVAYADPVSLSFHDKLISRERSPVAPALAAIDRRLVIGWKGDGNNSLDVATVQSAGPTLTTLPLTQGETLSMEANDRLLAVGRVLDDHTAVCEFAAPRLDRFRGLTETTPDSPALATLDGRLFLGWKGDGNDALNLAFSDDAGDTFGHKLISDVGSPFPPALCGHRSDVFMAWQGEIDREIRIGRVAMSGAAITGVVDIIPLGETTPVNPALGSLGLRLFVAFRGDDDRIYILYSDDNGRTFGHRHASAETTQSAPVLFSRGAGMFVAWRGTDNRINLAQIDVPALPGAAIAGLAGKRTLDEPTPASVAATVLDDAVFLAWKGLGNDYLNFTTNGAPRSFDEKHTSLEHSRSAPALCSDGNSVYVAWRNDGDTISVARVEFGAPPATP